jgi:3-methyl-2-oxobutanoate hydroxymethyltransferase
MHGKITISDLQRMKREGRKSVGVVAWDYQIARIADRAGFDFISVGDSVGVNLWGRADVLDVTLDEMLMCCRAVRCGAECALVSCDMPYGPVQQGSAAALTAARRLMHDGGADMIKVDAADRRQIRHSLQRAEFAGRTGERRSSGKARRRSKAPGSGRRLAP